MSSTPDSGQPTGPEHVHGRYRMTEVNGSLYGLNRPVSLVPIGQLVGASLEGCGPCQAAALDTVAADPALAARLCDLVGTGYQLRLGGLPPTMTDPDHPVSQVHPQLRRYFALGCTLRTGEGPNARVPLYEFMCGLDLAERRAACDNALDFLTGILALPW
jgi:hypothetical protein